MILGCVVWCGAGGKDSASPRYVFTTMSPLMRTIFHPHDDALLKYLNDDGLDIEPVSSRFFFFALLCL
jgi:hypothetical protein